MSLGPAQRTMAGYVAALALAVFTYFYGLGGQHIPRNGDEDVYAHITRLTAHSGQWLPLRSELHEMRNTKPPLLFWQGIASTGRGTQWDWWHLRYPSVLYTLLTALLVFLLGRRISGQAAVGVTAALAYLAFFSTYRYGRPFLVNPAETFWLFLPFFTLLYCRPRGFESRLWLPLLLGVEIGIGLLYKSFALLAPVGLALAWWYLHGRNYDWRAFLRKDAAKPVLTGIVALALFALWFAFDPDPQAVWREFVLGENAGKFAPHAGSYLAQMLWGGSSIWVLLLGYPFNAGLLALPVMALFVIAWKQRREIADEERLLWLWMLALFIVFALPSQRSARYLLDAMPGMALLLALNWQRIPRWVFVLTLLACGAVLALLLALALRLQQEAGVPYGWAYWLFMGMTLALLLAALRRAWTRGLVNVAALLTLLALAMFLAPFEGPLGMYDSAARSYVQDRTVWVPCDFRAHDEMLRMQLPGTLVRGYDETRHLQLEELAARYPLFAVQLPPAAAVCQGCKVIGQRLEIRGRHSAEELQAMLRGEVYRHLFVREWLLEAPQRNAAPEMESGEACR